MDQTGLPDLPDDALADILRRLPPRGLAASRCVRKAWRAVVDDRRLLLPHVLPHSLHGLFINYIDYKRPHLFARPSGNRPAINGNFLPGYPYDCVCDPVVDHCNGLVLYDAFRGFCVANPATRRWDNLPRRRDDSRNCHAYLVFDPAVSPHYEVFSVPDLPAEQEVDPHDFMEWPPSLWKLQVFSSSTKQWQERSFVRQGEAAGTVKILQLDALEPHVGRAGPTWRYGVYWQGSLYVHCRGSFVARLSLPDAKYQVIKSPIDIAESKLHSQYLGKSEKGVCFATIHGRYQLRVWSLDESSGQIDWVLRHHIDMKPWATLCNFGYFCLVVRKMATLATASHNVEMYSHRAYISLITQRRQTLPLKTQEHVYV